MGCYEEADYGICSRRRRLRLRAGEALPVEHLLLVRPGDEVGKGIMVVEATGAAFGPMGALDTFPASPKDIILP